MEKIGILHPGEMGISVAASAQNSGYTVAWVAEGRSPQTRQRAERHGLEEIQTLAELCRTCRILVSVCPPSAAEQLAQAVLANAFQGLFVDANAISPQRVMRIGRAMAERGVEFVDGGIIGGPAWQPGTTWLYLSGGGAPRVAACFSAGPLEAVVIGAEPGKASALKMCYAAYTKGTTALLTAILGVAEGWRVRTELEGAWTHDQPEFAAEAVQRARRVTAKAWRFAGEMDEIAATFEAVGMPGGFHQAAGEVYQRLAKFKGRETRPELDELLRALLEA